MPAHLCHRWRRDSSLLLQVRSSNSQYWHQVMIWVSNLLILSPLPPSSFWMYSSSRHLQDDQLWPLFLPPEGSAWQYMYNCFLQLTILQLESTPNHCRDKLKCHQIHTRQSVGWHPDDLKSLMKSCLQTTVLQSEFNQFRLRDKSHKWSRMNTGWLLQGHDHKHSNSTTAQAYHIY